MMKENNKKLFIIKPPGYRYESLESYLTYFENLFHKILGSLKISTPCGKPTSIKLNLDRVNPEIIKAEAKRENKEPGDYEITMYAGISYPLWIVSRTFAIPEYDILPWVEQCTISDERLIKLSKKEILAEYAYFLGSYYVLLHEFSHIALGHLDYIYDQMKLNHLSEFQDEKRRRSPEEIRITKAFEAEADRQAGQWLVGVFEDLLKGNSLGSCLSFPSKLDAYEFYVYVIATVFRVLQDLTQGEEGTHPKPNERLYILIGSLSKYFSQNLPDEHDKIYNHALKSCFEAGKKLLVIDSYEPLTVIQNARNLAFVDDVLREINIGRYQHKFEVITAQ